MTWPFSVLDDLGLSYSTRVTPAGLPYAGFQLSDEETASVPLTLIAEDATLRLTAHDVQPSFSAEQLLLINRRLPLARAYLQPADGTTEVALSLFLGSSRLSSDQMGVLLGHLLDSYRVVTGQLASPITRPVLPGTADVRAEQLIAAFARRGDQLLQNGRDVAVEADLGDSGRRCRLAGWAGTGWVMATAQFLPSPLVPPVLATLQRLQLWTRAGRFTVDDTGRLAAEVATPALDDSVEALAEWTVAQATLMLQVAMRHLSS
jgi:hypothetical protein